MIKTDALVLRRIEHRESDWILTLFTRVAGKVSAVARGARRSRRRFGGGALGFLTVSRVELAASPRSEMATLLAAEPLASYADLAGDLACFAHASYGTELVRELTAAGQADEAVFDLLVELYECLRARGAVAAVLRRFELRLLGELGFAPVFDRCAACRAEGDPAFAGGGLLDPDRGGAVCARCAPASRGLGVRPLAEPARRLLAAAQAERALAAAEAAADGDAAEARDATLALLSHHLGRTLRSVEFIAKLRAEPGHSG